MLEPDAADEHVAEQDEVGGQAVPRMREVAGRFFSNTKCPTHAKP